MTFVSKEPKASSQPFEAVYRDLGQGLLAVDHELRSALESSDTEIQELIAHVARYGGKRLRPALAILMGRAFGSNDPRIQKLGAVLEMIHLATLVHDDVIDVAELRRNQPTVHSRFGNYEAVLLGDIIFARAIHLLAKLGDEKCLLDLTRAVSTLCEGEILQNRHRRDAELSESLYYRIIGAKTAILYGAGAELAALLAGADEVQQKLAFRYGYELGLAFQIVDDCLDLMGDEAIVGKSLGTDLSAGKMTLPLILLRDRGDPHLAALVRRSVAGEIVEGASVNFRTELKNTGAIEAAMARAESHVQEARASITAARPSKHLDDLLAVGALVLSRRS